MHVYNFTTCCAKFYEAIGADHFSITEDCLCGSFQSSANKHRSPTGSVARGADIPR